MTNASSESDSAGLQIETARLVLRPPREQDFERFAELQADASAAQYIGGVLPRATAWRKFLQQPGAWFVQGYGMFSVIDRGDGRWLGQVGPWRPDGWPGNEIGYMFHPDAWGRGLATEAGLAAVRYAFETLQWPDIIHCIHPDNAPSIALAKRLGSHWLRTGELPEPWAGEAIEIYGQSREQWQARSGSLNP